MKKLIIVIIIFLLCTGVFGQETEKEEGFSIIKTGEKASFDGVLVKEDKFREMVKVYTEYKKLQDWYDKLEKNQLAQIIQLESRVQLLEEKVKLVTEKYNLEMALRIEIRNEYNKIKDKSDFLVISNAIGWGVGASTILGVSVYLLVSYFSNN